MNARPRAAPSATLEGQRQCEACSVLQSGARQDLSGPRQGGTNAEEGAFTSRPREEKRWNASSTAYHSIVTSTLDDPRFAASRSHALPSSSAASAGERSPSWQVIAATIGLLAGPRVYPKPSAVRSTVKTAFMMVDNYRNEEVDKIGNFLEARRTVESVGSFAAHGTQGKVPLSEATRISAAGGSSTARQGRV